jgi:hypothetical protein
VSQFLCDKVPDIKNLKEERLLAHYFRGFDLSLLGPIAFGPIHHGRGGYMAEETSYLPQLREAKAEKEARILVYHTLQRLCPQ